MRKRRWVVYRNRRNDIGKNFGAKQSRTDTVREVMKVCSTMFDEQKQLKVVEKKIFFELKTKMTNFSR